MMETALLIIDIQEKLVRAFEKKYVDRMVTQINLLVNLAVELQIPILLTEQYPQGLGPTIGPIKKILDGKPYDYLTKLTFGCCEDSKIQEKIRGYGKKNFILTGMETHVCVYLTALGLIDLGVLPFIASDAVASRDEFYYKNGLQLMRDAGATVTNTETLLFQLMGQCATPTFKKISQLLKESLK